MGIDLSSSRLANPAAAGDNVLVVDDEPLVRDLLSDYLSNLGYTCSTAGTGRQALDWLELNPVALVIADIRMPELNGLQLLENLTRRYPETAAIMITAVADIDTAIDTMKQGAFDYITKPFNLEAVADSVKRALSLRRARLENQRISEGLQKIVHEKTNALNTALKDITTHREMTLGVLMNVLDARGHETQIHSQRVQAYTLRLARQMEFSGDRLVDLARGALLHDIGKVGIPDKILLKPGKLDAHEWEIMKSHTTIGYQILSGVKFLDRVAEMVLSHHERFDGNGYPRRISGKEIPLEARMFSILDAYDAMTSDRPYRDAQSIAYAVSEINQAAGKQFDACVVEQFLKVPVEEWVQIGQTYRERSD